MSDPWLAGPVTTTAYGWRLERSDGITLGFTSHDHDVAVDGVLLRASPGMLPSSIVESIGLETDGLAVGGAITSSAIDAGDLAAGRWDAARLEIFLFDWNNPEAGKRLLAAGELGAVSYSKQAFEAEILGLTTLLDRPVVPQTSPSCRASFCDADCGLNRSRFTHTRTVASTNSDRISLTPVIAANKFSFGNIRWLNGANCGLKHEVVGNGTNIVILDRPPHSVVEIGATVELFEGCDKQLETCAVRFDNTINFRGEPHLPGNDLLTRYPGAG